MKLFAICCLIVAWVGIVMANDPSLSSGMHNLGGALYVLGAVGVHTAYGVAVEREKRGNPR